MNKILLKLMDVFRSEPIPDKGALLSLTLVAWHKASMNSLCPSHLQMKNCLAIRPNELGVTLAELAKVMRDDAFLIEDAGISRMRQPVLSEAISKCLEMGEDGFLTNFDPTDAALAFEIRDQVFPVEVCDLVVGLAGDISNQDVYLPWESNGQISGRVLKKGASGMVETRFHTKLPQLVSSILSDGKRLKVANDDLLINPHYVENGQLKTFSTTIALLPFGVNVSTEIKMPDLYNRFRLGEKTRSLTVLTVRHVVAQTKGRAIFTAMNSILFSAGAERNLREDLLRNEQLEAVVAMPAGLLDNAAIPFSILIINTEKRCNKVRFVNADSLQFKEDISRTKSRLKNIDELIDTILTAADGANVKVVSTEEILANDAQLQVNRYALGAKEQKVAKLLASMQCKSLEDIATLVKPIANIASKDDISENTDVMYEVGASDIPEYGYIHTASKQIALNPKFSKTVSQFLIPNDIVLIIKGTLGKVGIIPNDVPAPGVGGWIAGQSAAVIRVEKSSGIDPRALFMLLRSELGKELVKALESGAAIPFVQLRELKQLSIPIPTNQESIEAINALMTEETLQQEINELQKRQTSLSANCWSLKNNEEIG